MRPWHFLVVAPVFLALASLAPARGAQKVVDHDYIGAERCRACHAEEHAALSRGPHARAYEVLGEKDRQDPRCLSCHTMVPDDVSAGLQGIQCESCHGPGRNYSIEWVMRDRELAGALQLQEVTEQTCKRCHTDSSPSLVPFDYAAKLELIRHWPEDTPASKLGGGAPPQGVPSSPATSRGR